MDLTALRSIIGGTPLADVDACRRELADVRAGRGLRDAREVAVLGRLDEPAAWVLWTGQGRARALSVLTGSAPTGSAPLKFDRFRARGRGRRRVAPSARSVRYAKARSRDVGKLPRECPPSIRAA